MVVGPLVEMLARNRVFAQKYTAPPGLMQLIAKLKSSGQGGVIVLSCSDPRLDPDKILGLDANLRATHIRNGGGRAFDALRSFVVLQTLGGPATIAVMHHTDCGMIHFRDADIKKVLLEFSPQDKENIEGARFGAISGSIEDSAREDVAFLKASPWIKPNTQIIGLKYDIDTGLLSEVSDGKSEL